MSSYAHATDIDTTIFRIRTARGDITKCQLVYGDTACRNTPVDTFTVDMSVAYQDEFFDYYEIKFQCQFHRICYAFSLSDGKQQLYYYGNAFYDHLPIDRSEYYKLPFVRCEDIVDAPMWVKNAIVYNIFPDSFATSKGYISNQPTVKNIDCHTYNGKLGGTINGIRQNLDYISSLGVDTVYLNPIFSAGQYHKYDIIDYYSVDPCFGTNEDFAKLVEELHSRDMKIIIDGVFNHCGWQFFAFDSCVRNGKASPYWNWFYRLTEPVVRPDCQDDYPQYECFGYERLMPKLNTGNAEVQKYFCDVGAHWVSQYHIDGWRLDVADEVNDEFWRAFNKAVKQVNANTVIIGEVWQSATHWLDGSMFDSAMNYIFMRSCRDFFATRQLDANSFNGRVTEMLTTYKHNVTYAQLNLLDSHDVARFLSLCDNIELYKQAVLFQLTFVGTPSIFYGNEQGLTGILEEEYRRPMQFGDGQLLQFFKQVIALRNNYPCLRLGSFVATSYNANSRLYMYQRQYEQTRIAIVLNGDNCQHTVNCKGKVLISSNFSGTIIDAYGYAVILLED